MIIPVILSGGSGTRLWPISRKGYPKQFLPLSDSGKTLLQETVLRLPDCADPIVVCNQAHRFVIAEQLQQIQQTPLDIILEPVGKNTAPAVAIAALRALENDPDAILLILAADHVIKQQAAFHTAIEKAQVLAEQDYLVTFGIPANQPETGYGYIQHGERLDQCEDCYTIHQFVEKPDSATAERYVSSGEYDWNSGMFMFKAKRFLQELAQFAPDMLTACEQSFQTAQRDLDFLRLDEQQFAACPEDSIDYAVMEKTHAAAVVRMDAEWSDVGSWSALWETLDKDSNDNVMRGTVFTQDCQRAYLHADHRIITALGVSDIVVVETPDAVMVASLEAAQDVKKVVKQLQQAGRTEATSHRKIYRPWGNYDCIDKGHRYQVKRIVVKPGETLSTQQHHHRAEHWIVVKGTANVTLDDKQFLLTENQSTYIPIGTVHALANPGKILLEMIEVQSGSYLGEDDIVRLLDAYGRVTSA